MNLAIVIIGAVVVIGVLATMWQKLNAEFRGFPTKKMPPTIEEYGDGSKHRGKYKGRRT